MSFEGFIRPSGELATKIHRYPWWKRVRDYVRRFVRRVL